MKMDKAAVMRLIQNDKARVEEKRKMVLERIETHKISFKQIDAEKKKVMLQNEVWAKKKEDVLE